MGMQPVRNPQKPYASGILMILFLATFFALGQPLEASLKGNEEAVAAHAKAMGFVDQGDMQSARIELLNAIKADPQWATARVAQGHVMLKLGDAIAAEQEFRQAIKLGENPAFIRHLLGHALQIQGQHKRAQEQLLADDIPEGDRAYAARILARSALQTDDNDLAKFAFNRAIALDDRNSDLWVDIARFRADGGDQAGAIKAVDEAVALDVANIRALKYRGELLRAQFGLAAALPWFEKALQVDSNNIGLLTEYASTLGDMGRMKDMLIVTRQILAIDKRNPRAFFMQAVLAARAGKFQLARTLMQKTEGELENMPAAILVQGVLEYGGGNYNAAVEKFRKLSSMQPNNYRVRTLLAQSLYRLGKHQDSIELIASIARRPDADRYALWVAGRTSEGLDQKNEASWFLNRASVHEEPGKRAFVDNTPLHILGAQYSRNRGNARFAIPYVRGLYAAGNLNRAYSIAKNLQRDNPGAVDAHIMAADTALALGRRQEALVALDRARQISFSEPIMLRMVEIMRSQRKFQESGELLAQFLQYNPRNLAALRWIAYGHMETQNWPVAVEILESLHHRIGANDAVLTAALAESYNGMGMHDKALKKARLAYKTLPSHPAITHIYGLVMLDQKGKLREAVDLLKKAVLLSPKNKLFKQSLRRAYDLAEAHNKS